MTTKEWIKQRMDESIEEIEDIIKEIKLEHLESDLLTLNYLDKLNELSITY